MTTDDVAGPGVPRRQRPLAVRPRVYVRGRTANVPLGTTLPSAVIGFVYGTTFFTPGMTMSAAGPLLTGVMWGLVAALRSPSHVRDRLSTRASFGEGAD